MTFIYVIIAYGAGIGTVLLVFLVQTYADSLEKENPIPAQPPDIPQAVQFVDPVTPEEKFKNLDVNKLEIHD